MKLLSLTFVSFFFFFLNFNFSAELSKPILEPMCKNAIVLGGSNGFGFAAADHLLVKGARVGVIC